MRLRIDLLYKRLYILWHIYITQKKQGQYFLTGLQGFAYWLQYFVFVLFFCSISTVLTRYYRCFIGFDSDLEL